MWMKRDAIVLSNNPHGTQEAAPSLSKGRAPTASTNMVSGVLLPGVIFESIVNNIVVANISSFC